MKRKHTAAALLLAVCMSFGAYMPASASAADINYGIPGLGVAYQMGLGYTYQEPLKI